MEAVAQDALVCEGPRQGEQLRDARLRSVELGVEAGDLRKFRPTRADGADRREVVRLMAGRERDEPFEPL